MTKRNLPPKPQPAPVVHHDGFSQKLEWVLLGLIFAAPLTIHLKMHDTFDLPKLFLLYIGVGVGGVLWAMSHAEGNRWRSSPLFKPVLFFLAVTWISALCSIEMPMSIFGSYRVYSFGALPITMLAVLMALACQVSRPPLLPKIAWAALLSGALVGFYGYLQYSGMEFLEAMPRIVGGRPWSTLGNPVYLGALCMMALPLGLALWSEKPGVSRFWSGLFLIGGMTGLVLSLSRGAWMGAIVGSLITVGALVRQDRKRLSGFRTLVVCACVGMIFAVVSMPETRQRLTTFVSLREGSNAARLQGWNAALKGWQERPLIGWGPDTFVRTFRRHRSLDYIRAAGPGVTQAHVHNDLLQMASTQGLLGVLGYLLILGVVAKNLWRRFRSDDLSPMEIGLAGSLVALLVQNQFNFSSISTAIWAAVFTGLLFAAPARDEATTYVSPAARWRLPLYSLLAFMGLWWLSRPVRAEWFFTLAQREQQEGKSLDAFRAVDQAIELVPYNGVYKMERSNMMHARAAQVEGSTRLSLLNSALSTVQTITAEHPTDPDAWNNLGVAAMWMTQMAGVNRMADAQKAFQEAIAIDPVFVDAWANLARWEHLAGDLEAEDRLWQKVLTIDPSHAMARQVLQQHGKPLS